MLLFIDSSGAHNDGAPYEVLGGIAIRESDLWNLVQTIRSIEKEIFGAPLADHGRELKGNKLLKKKTFRLAAQSGLMHPPTRRHLVEALMQNPANPTREQLTAYGQACLDYVHQVLDLCGQYRVKVFASIVNGSAPRPTGDYLRKDYVYLFERYYHFLDNGTSSEMGLIVFDEEEKTRSRVLVSQMEKYFLRTRNGRLRSGRIVPEPFFVHSDLTMGVQLADIVAYSLNWGIRLNGMTAPIREEMRPFGEQAFQLRYVSQRADESRGSLWPMYGVIYLDDLRPRGDREFMEESA